MHFVLYSLSLCRSLFIAVSIQHVLRAGSCNNTQESPPSDLDPLGAHNPIQIGESEVSREVVVFMNLKHAGLRDENNAESLLLLAVGRVRPRRLVLNRGKANSSAVEDSIMVDRNPTAYLSLVWEVGEARQRQLPQGVLVALFPSWMELYQLMRRL